MGLMKKLTSGLVAASLVFGLVGSAFADMSDANAVKAAADRMVTLKVVDGMPGGDLQLGANLTRAQVVKIIVTAFGKKDTAALLTDAPSFADVKGHWAAGYIALAKAIATQNGFGLGYPDGSFKPEGQVTFAEVLGLIEKFMNVKPTAGLSYPNDVIDAAVNAGIIDAKDKATIAAFPNQAINRGQAFFLADNAFSKVAIDGTKTVYQKYDSATMPSVTVDSYNATTTATSVTLSGKVANAVSLKVNGAAVTPAADGTWTATVTLDKVGANTIAVEAYDLVGNKAVPASPVAITRNPGAAASIDASLSADSVTAGGTATLSVKVMDANGVELKDATYTVTPDATVGTYDATTGTFTAAKTPATGNITITSGSASKTVAVTVTAGALDSVVASAPSVAPGEKVTLTAKDANGNAITSGVAYSQTSADALLDSTQGVFIASKPGSYTVTATAGGVSKTVTIGVYDAASKLAVSVSGPVTGNYNTHTSGDGSYATVTVKVVDANGNVAGADSSSITLASTPATGVTIKGAVSGSATETAVAGVATFKVYADSTLAGLNVSLSATDGTLTAGKGTLTVNPQVATKVAVDTDSDFVGVASATNLGYTVKVLDQDGFEMASGSWDATLSLTGPATLSNNDVKMDVTLGNGEYTDNLTSKVITTGSITLTAAIDGLQTSSASKTVSAVFVGGAKKVSIDSSADKFTAGGTAITYTVTLLDSQGAKVADTDASLPANLVLDLTAMSSTDFGHLVLKDGSNASLNLVGGQTQQLQIPQTSGLNEYTFTISDGASAGNTLSGNIVVNITGKDAAGNALTAASKTLTVAPGAAAAVKLSSTTDKYLPITGPTTQVTAQLYDAQGNKVAKAGYTLHFAAAAITSGASANDVTINGTTGAVDVKTDATGAATVTVNIQKYLNNQYTITVTDPAGSPLTASSNVVNLYVDGATTQNMSLAVYKKVGTSYIPTTQVAAGDTIQIRATVTDSNGVPRIAHVGLALSSTDKIFQHAAASGSTPPTVWDGASTTAGAVTGWTAVSGAPGVYASDDLVIAKSGLVNFSVKDTYSSTGVSATGNVLVTAGAAARVSVAEADYNGSIAITKNSVSPAFTLKLTDAWGNAVTGTGSTTIDIGTTGTDAGKIVQVGTTASTLGVANLSVKSSSPMYIGITDLGGTSASPTASITLSVHGSAYTTTLGVYGK